MAELLTGVLVEAVGAVLVAVVVRLFGHWLGRRSTVAAPAMPTFA